MTDELDAELAAWAESDAPVTVPGRIRRGAAARAAGRRALAWAGYPNVEAGPIARVGTCLLYTSPSPRDKRQSRMPSSA